MIIGTFTKSEDGVLLGEIHTLALKSKVKLMPAEKKSDRAPDFRVFTGLVEIGAAWKNTSREDRAYISVMLDDPSFVAPIYANLFEGEDGEYNLLWARKTKED